MPSFEVTFEVFCARCGAGLCNQTDTRTSFNRREPQITVEPCDNCISQAADKARSDGYDEGYQTRKEEEPEE